MSRYEIDMEPQDTIAKTHITKVIHCRGTKNVEGLIMIHTLNILPHAVFRVRLSGPEAHIIPFKHLSEEVHYGQYRVARPGEYNVEVMMLYTHFNETHIRNSVFMDSSKTLISTSPFVVASDHLSDSVSEIPCDEFDATWIVDDGFRGYLRRTRTWAQDLWPTDHPMIHDLLPTDNTTLLPTTNTTGLQLESRCKPITPYGLSSPIYKDCFKRENICMWGDSQMRHLYNTIVAALLMQSAEALTVQKNILDGQDFIKYFAKSYDNFEQDIDSLLASGKCNVIIANFGQWPAGHPQGYPWSFDKFRVYLEADIVYLKKMEEKHIGVRIFWMTTNPHGYVGGMLKGTEWRTEPVLDRYHDITVQLTLAHRLKALDTYRIAKPLSDLTYDGSHYQGIVGWTLASYVLQNVCEL
jgi:hypothetical protein